MFKIYPQIPLESLSHKNDPDCAVIFIGGFFDWFIGVSFKLFNEFGGMGEGITSIKAYYHWDGGFGGMIFDKCLRIADDVNRFASIYPHTHLVLIGHSYGGSAAMHISRHLRLNKHVELIVLTLDAVSRWQSSRRAERVTFWGNAYLSRGGGLIDIVPRIGGRWGACPEADIDYSYDGNEGDALGNLYSHRRPTPMLLNTPDQEGMAKSLWGIAKKRLNTMLLHQSYVG